MPSIRQQVVEGIGPGTVFEIKRTFSPAEVEAFGHLTRDYNPVHYDPEFAQGKGFSGLICHGLLFGAMICEVGGQLAWLASGMSFKFIAPVYFGDTITCRLTITQVDPEGRARAEVLYHDQNGRQVAAATITGRLPGDGDKRRLRAMMVEGDPTNPLAGEGRDGSGQA